MSTEGEGRQRAFCELPGWGDSASPHAARVLRRSIAEASHRRCSNGGRRPPMPPPSREVGECRHARSGGCGSRTASAHLPAILISPSPAALFAGVHRLLAGVPAPTVPTPAPFSAGCGLHRVQSLGGGANPGRSKRLGPVRSRWSGDEDAGRDQHETDLSHFPLPRLPPDEPIPLSPALPSEFAGAPRVAYATGPWQQPLRSPAPQAAMALRWAAPAAKRATGRGYRRSGACGLPDRQRVRRAGRSRRRPA
jgi:hypothetical protein